MTKIIVKTENAPAAIGPYSQGIGVNGIFYFSGQIGLDPKTQTMAIGFSAQLKMIMQNIDGLLSSQGLTRDNIIKTSIFVTDLNHFAEVNQAYTEFFKAPYPARSTIEVSKLPKDGLVEIEVIAAK
jgi:2-iminobutanoate/2-iminopropanoate deaminase